MCRLQVWKRVRTKTVLASVAVFILLLVLLLAVSIATNTAQWSATARPRAARSVHDRSDRTTAALGLQPYFGNLHSHSALSDGTGSPTEAYHHAREVGLDFLAVTDHAELLDQTEWQQLRSAAARATDDAFVAMHGFEWTSGGPQAMGRGYGHMIVLNSEHYLRSFNCNLSRFYRFVGDDPDALGMFHPTFGNRYDDFAYDESSDTAVALFEVHNTASEESHPMYPRGRFEDAYQRALARGWHVGAVANQDNHDADWGDRDMSRTGVWAEALTHDAIYDAMRARRTFATELPVELSFTLDGYWMGEQIGTTGENGSLLANVSIQNASAPVARLELIGNGTVIASYDAMNATNIGWSRPITPTGTNAVTGECAVYARVQFANGYQAWTSPVWVRSETSSSARRSSTPAPFSRTDNGPAPLCEDDEPPILSPPPTALYAPGTGAQRFGAAIASGDFNGDERTDLAVGAPGTDIAGRTAAGAVFVYLQTENEPLISDTNRPADIVLAGAAPYDAYGSALAVADLNNDGYDELIVGAWLADIDIDIDIDDEVEDDDEVDDGLERLPDAGAVTVHSGEEWGVAVQPSLRLVGRQPRSQFGRAIAVADFDGDGRLDLAVGASGSSVGGTLGTGVGAAGQVSLYRGIGRGAGIEPDPVTLINGTMPYGEFGNGLAAADLDGDRCAELAVAAPYQLIGFEGDPWTRSWLGQVSLHAGSPTTLVEPTARRSIDGTSTTRNLGSALDILRSPHAQQQKDALLVGARPADSSTNKAGNVTILIDALANTGAPSLVLEGTAGPSGFGSALGAGDIDSDGAIELMVGDPTRSTITVYSVDIGGDIPTAKRSFVIRPVVGAADIATEGFGSVLHCASSGWSTGDLRPHDLLIGVPERPAGKTPNITAKSGTLARLSTDPLLTLYPDLGVVDATLSSTTNWSMGAPLDTLHTGSLLIIDATLANRALIPLPQEPIEYAFIVNGTVVANGTVTFPPPTGEWENTTQYRTISVQWTPPSQGNYTLELRVDPGDTIEEYDESNNLKRWSVEVTPSPPPQPPPPDLAVGTISTTGHSNGTIVANTTLAVSATIVVSNCTSSIRQLIVEWSVHDGTELETSNRSIITVPNSTSTSTSTGTGTKRVTMETTWSWTPPEGNRSISICIEVDPDERIEEHDEHNNRRCTAITVLLAAERPQNSTDPANDTTPDDGNSISDDNATMNNTDGLDGLDGLDGPNADNDDASTPTGDGGNTAFFSAMPTRALIAVAVAAALVLSLALAALVTRRHRRGSG